jgi:hypothetical protein
MSELDRLLFVGEQGGVTRGIRPARAGRRPRLPVGAAADVPWVRCPSTRTALVPAAAIS